MARLAASATLPSRLDAGFTSEAEGHIGSETPATNCQEAPGPAPHRHHELNQPHSTRNPARKSAPHKYAGMTTQHEMEMAYAAQQEVIDALHGIGDHDLANRLTRCMTTRQVRHYGCGWPYSCRSSACLWCRRAMMRGWWSGIRYWSEAASTSSLAVIPVLSPAGLPDAVRRVLPQKITRVVVAPTPVMVEPMRFLSDRSWWRSTARCCRICPKLAHRAASCATVTTGIGQPIPTC